MANSSQSITFFTISPTLASNMSRSSVSEVAADTSSRKSSSSERSRKRTVDLRGVAMLRGLGTAGGRFDNLHAGAGADAARAGGCHFFHVFKRAHAARRFDAHAGT